MGTTKDHMYMILGTTMNITASRSQHTPMRAKCLMVDITVLDHHVVWAHSFCMQETQNEPHDQAIHTFHCVWL